MSSPCDLPRCGRGGTPRARRSAVREAPLGRTPARRGCGEEDEVVVGDVRDHHDAVGAGVLAARRSRARPPRSSRARRRASPSRRSPRSWSTRRSGCRGWSARRGALRSFARALDHDRERREAGQRGRRAAPRSGGGPRSGPRFVGLPRAPRAPSARMDAPAEFVVVLAGRRTHSVAPAAVARAPSSGEVQATRSGVPVPASRGARARCRSRLRPRG